MDIYRLPAAIEIDTETGQVGCLQKITEDDNFDPRANLNDTGLQKDSELTNADLHTDEHGVDFYEGHRPFSRAEEYALFAALEEGRSQIITGLAEMPEALEAMAALYLAMANKDISMSVVTPNDATRNADIAVDVGEEDHTNDDEVTDDEELGVSNSQSGDPRFVECSQISQECLTLSHLVRSSEQYLEEKAALINRLTLFRLGDGRLIELGKRFKKDAPDSVRAGLSSIIASRDKLVLHNFGLVRMVAVKSLNRGLLLDDLKQEGRMGLLRAAESFDHHSGYKFSTYATHWIRQFIWRAVANQGREMRVPVHKAVYMSKVGAARDRFLQSHGRHATASELAEILEIPESRVQKILAIPANPLSLQTSISVGEDDSLIDFIADDSIQNPENLVGGLEDSGRIQSLLETLSPRDQKVLRMRYGVGEGAEYTLEEVGIEIGVTRERVRQIQLSSLRKLAKRMRALDAVTTDEENTVASNPVIERLLRKRGRKACEPQNKESLGHKIWFVIGGENANLGLAALRFGISTVTFRKLLDGAKTVTRQEILRKGWLNVLKKHYPEKWKVCEHAILQLVAQLSEGSVRKPRSLTKQQAKQKAEIVVEKTHCKRGRSVKPPENRDSLVYELWYVCGGKHINLRAVAAILDVYPNNLSCRIRGKLEITKRMVTQKGWLQALKENFPEKYAERRKVIEGYVARFTATTKPPRKRTKISPKGTAPRAESNVDQPKELQKTEGNKVSDRDLTTARPQSREEALEAFWRREASIFIRSHVGESLNGGLGQVKASGLKDEEVWQRMMSADQNITPALYAEAVRELCRIKKASVDKERPAFHRALDRYAPVKKSSARPKLEKGWIRPGAQ